MRKKPSSSKARKKISLFKIKKILSSSKIKKILNSSKIKKILNSLKMKKTFSTLVIVGFLLLGSAFAEFNDIPFNISLNGDISLPSYNEFKDKIDDFFEQVVQLVTEVNEVSSEEDLASECEALRMMGAPNAAKICEIAGIDWKHDGNK